MVRKVTPDRIPRSGTDGDEAAEAESGAFGGRHFHPAANHAVRQVIELADLHANRRPETRDRQAIGGPHLQQELVGIHLDGFVGALSRDQARFNPPPNQVCSTLDM